MFPVRATNRAILPVLWRTPELSRLVPDSGVWFGIMAPAGTLSALVARMARDLEAVVGSADTRARSLGIKAE